MKIKVRLIKPILFEGVIQRALASDTPGMVTIESNDAGVVFETEDRYHFVPWHNVEEAVTYK